MKNISFIDEEIKSNARLVVDNMPIRQRIRGGQRVAQSIERVTEMYAQPYRFTALNWPRANRDSRIRANPCEFFWASETVRDDMLTMLFGATERHDYPAEKIMRRLMYRVRKGKCDRRSALEGHYWAYYTYDQFASQLGMTPKFFRKKVDQMEDEGWLIKVFVQGVTKCAHYRLSDDLFRLCLKITEFSDETAFYAKNGRCPSDEEWKDNQAIITHAFSFHRVELEHILGDFAVSKSASRAKKACHALDALFVKCGQAIGSLMSDLQNEMYLAENEAMREEFDSK